MAHRATNISLLTPFNLQVVEGARLFKYVFYVTVAVFTIVFMTGCQAFWLVVGTYLIATARARIAEVYGIPLNPVANWCLSFWCGCCVVTQVQSLHYTLQMLVDLLIVWLFISPIDPYSIFLMAIISLRRFA